jgi:HK97 family phage portal protein
VTPAPFNPVAWAMERLGAFTGGEAKAVFGITELGSSWATGDSLPPGAQDRDNFTTNRITVGEYYDRSAATEAGALTVATAWACVNILAGTQASLPRLVYRTDKDGKRTIAADHPLFSILRESPNADQTSMDYWEFMAACIELRGNGFSEIDRRGDGSVVALDVPIPPEWVTVRRRSSGALEYVVKRNGREAIIPQDRMLHIRGFGGSPLGGLSTLQFAARTLGFQQSVEASAAHTVRNGVKPSVSISVDRDLNPEQVREARRIIAEQYQGVHNAGLPYLAHSGQKVESLTFNPEDHLLLKGRGFGVEETCRFFGVPPFMVGHTEKSTSWGTGIEQQMRMFYTLTLRRRLKRIEQALEKQLLSPAERAERISIEFNVDGLLRGDSKTRAEFYASGLQNGWRTINEVRALENLPPVPGGDVPRLQMQVVPITEADAIEEPPPPTEDEDDED